MRRMEHIRDLVRKHNEKAQQKLSKALDQGKQEKTYKFGQEVVRRVCYLSSVEKAVGAKLILLLRM